MFIDPSSVEDRELVQFQNQCCLHFLEIGGALQFETLDWEGWDDFGKTGLFWSGDGGGVII